MRCGGGFTRMGLAFLLGAALNHAAVGAPPDRVVRIGMLTSGAPVRWDMVERATEQGLRDLGYVEGKNLVLLKRTATSPDNRMDAYAQELVDKNVDAIVTSCGWSTTAALKVTASIPIVMGSLHDPVGRGFIKSLARPGTNVTGQTGHLPDLAPKMLEYMRIAQPSARVIGVLSNPGNSTHRPRYTEMQPAARAFGLSTIEIDLRRLTTLKATRESFRSLGVQALMVLPDDDLYFEFLGRIFPVSEELRIPTFFTKRDLVDIGGVFSYGADSPHIFRRSAYFVDKILNGANPAELAVEQPTKLEFAINLKKANAMGIEVPRVALMRADWVVR